MPESQLEAVSFGKEKPLVEGHDETAWSQNRRVDLFTRADALRAVPGARTKQRTARAK